MSSENNIQFSQVLSQNSKSERISLVWENINLSVTVKDQSKSSFFNPAYKNKQILDNVSGKAFSGDLVAIMGPTGKFNCPLTLYDVFHYSSPFRLWENEFNECFSW
jgi:ABC-type multidrug transport system fused ATPase/permease subunit